MAAQNGGAVPGGGGLKKFVSEMKGSNSRMVEMRITCFAGGIIGTKVLLLDDMDNQSKAVSLSPFVFLIGERHLTCEVMIRDCLLV